jgi:signal transduction histidine kinase
MKTLSRQLIVAFLAVTVPGTAVLGGVTLYSLRTLGAVSDQLAEITLSLEATRDLDRALARAQAAVGTGPRFDTLMRTALSHAGSCATAECHASARTPAQMAGRLAESMERIRQAGAAPGASAVGARALLAALRDELEPMSMALLVRVEDLSAQARAVRRWTSLLVGSLTLVIALTACGAAVIVGDWVARPLRQVVVAIRRVMAGDWTSRVPAGGAAEVDEVASAFNAMVEELRRSREQLENYSRTLEADVTDRTAALEKKERELMQAEKLASLGRLAAGVAHELNNPLTSVVMSANLAMEELAPDSPLLEDLRRIEMEAQRCTRIIEDLHTFARHHEVRKLPGRVDAVVERALWSARAELDKRGIDVTRDIPPGLPPMSWDADRIVQVLTNLFVNAAQAMGQGGRLTVRCRGEDGWLRLEVRDTGPGVPAEHRSRIFDPFFTTKRDGTGLGLSISHGIVERHGGRIELASRTRSEATAGDETGTTVTIVLPVAVAA